MTTVDVRTRTGDAAGTVELDDAIFGIQPNVPVMHQVVTAQLAAARSGTQSTKTRAEVRGGGAKPWRQKGTGRARQGSTRAPHWAGGGVALGPKPRKYTQKTPKKMIQLALRSALSDRAGEGKVAVVSAWDFEAPKTKDAIASIEALGFDGRVLLVVGRDDEVAYKSFRNLDNVQLLLAGELNAYDVLVNDWVVFTRDTLPGGPAGTAAPAHEPVVAPDEAVNTAAPQVGFTADSAADDDAPSTDAATPGPEGSAGDEGQPTGKERSDAPSTDAAAPGPEGSASDEGQPTGKERSDAPSTTDATPGPEGSASDEGQPTGKERSDAPSTTDAAPGPEGSASDEGQPTGKERSDAEGGQ